MSTYLPMDVNDNPIPALRLKDGGAHSIAVGAVSGRNSQPLDDNTRIISLYSTSDVYLKCGDSGVVATTSDHFFPAGMYYDISIGGDTAAHYTHIAALRVSEDGMLYISEKE